MCVLPSINPETVNFVQDRLPMKIVDTAPMKIVIDDQTKTCYEIIKVTWLFTNETLHLTHQLTTTIKLSPKIVVFSCKKPLTSLSSK